MPLTGIALRAKRTEFYEAMRKEFRTTDEEIIRILINSGYETFDNDKTNEYRKIIQKSFNGQPTVVKTASTPGGEIKMIMPVIDSCPIPGCNGEKIRTSHGWKCSKGGTRHYFAMRSASIVVGRTAAYEDVRKKALEIIRGMEKIDVEKAQEEAREAAT